jgi:hypothetical protein
MRERFVSYVWMYDDVIMSMPQAAARVAGVFPTLEITKRGFPHARILHQVTIVCKKAYRPTFKCSLLPASPLQPWRWRQHASPKRWLLPSSLHGDLTQNNIITITDVCLHILEDFRIPNMDETENLDVMFQQNGTSP